MSLPLVAYMQRRDTLSASEVETLERLSHRDERVDAGRVVVEQGSSPKQSCLIKSGLAFRQTFMRDGRRMITTVHVPGDFVDLSGFLLNTLDHSVIAATECEISWVPHAELKRVTEGSPHLTRLLWMSSVVDGAITRRALSVVGRLSPAAKLAHLACEIYIRLKAVGCADSYRFDLPITQVDLSDIFGLSTVHLNRSLQTLRATGALTWEGGVVTIKDWDRLAEIGSFEADYLDLVRSSR